MGQTIDGSQVTLIELCGVRVVDIVFSMVFDFIIKIEIKHELHLLQHPFDVI